MRNRLYVSNLSATATEDQLRQVIGQYGEITLIEFGQDEHFATRYALVEMVAEKAATKAMNDLNGYKLNERCLSISYPEADLTRELLPKQRRAIEEIAAQLGETEKVPLRQLEALVRLTSISLAQALLKEAEEVDAADGMMTNDGTRKRTKGGVFFYLARPRVSPPVRQIVFVRKGKFPAAQPQEQPPSDAEAAATS
jgi:RNA recognition motif-containing protein